MVTFAQSNLAGKVQDTQSAPIAYATVSLLRTDSTLVTGTITDDAGAFALSAPSGKYLLQVSYIGYRTVCQTVKTGDKNEASYLADGLEIISIFSMVLPSVPSSIALSCSPLR